MAVHISKVRNMGSQLKLYGEKQSDSSILSKILYSLPEEYETSKSTFYALPNTEKTIKGLADFLIAEESRKKMNSASPFTPVIVVCLK